jgi:putative ATPase
MAMADTKTHITDFNFGADDGRTGVPNEDEAGGQWRAPLADRMRPKSLSEYLGQTHLLGEGRLLRRVIDTGRFTSIILHGPPGVGKTSLAAIIAGAAGARLEKISGVENGVADIRKVLSLARERVVRGRSTVLFVDEIHRLSRNQQDSLLPDVENGTVQLIGATTMNPSFYLSGALVSRSLVVELVSLGEEEVVDLLKRACVDTVRGFGNIHISVSDEALTHICRVCDGDARRSLGALELAVETTAPGDDGVVRITKEIAEECVQKKTPVYDRDGEGHYDTASAYIKSIRAGDPDAALYWLAKMIHAGEDIRFIARRLVISASEDIGLADSRGLLVAMAAHQACEMVGLPEARIPLAHATVYLATAPKSSSAYLGLQKAMDDVGSGRTLPIPDHQKPRAGKSRRGSGAETAGGSLDGRVFYSPSERGEEKRIKERLAYWKEIAEKGES